MRTCLSSELRTLSGKQATPRYGNCVTLSGKQATLRHGKLRDLAPPTKWLAIDLSGHGGYDAHVNAYDEISGLGVDHMTMLSDFLSKR